MQEIRITPVPSFMGFGYELRILDKEKKIFIENLLCKKVNDDTSDIVVPSLMILTKDEIIQLMDSLWDLGIRPSNGSGDFNAFTAVQYHLEDMRKLVFKDKGASK